MNTVTLGFDGEKTVVLAVDDAEPGEYRLTSVEAVVIEREEDGLWPVWALRALARLPWVGPNTPATLDALEAEAP